MNLIFHAINMERWISRHVARQTTTLSSIFAKNETRTWEDFYRRGRTFVQHAAVASRDHAFMILASRRVLCVGNAASTEIYRSKSSVD